MYVRVIFKGHIVIKLLIICVSLVEHCFTLLRLVALYIFVKRWRNRALGGILKYKIAGMDLGRSVKVNIFLLVFCFFFAYFYLIKKEIVFSPRLGYSSAFMGYFHFQ
jgi:hypothetical protein